MIDIGHRNCGQKETVIFLRPHHVARLPRGSGRRHPFGKTMMVVPDPSRGSFRNPALRKRVLVGAVQRRPGHQARSTTRSSTPGECSDRLAEEMMAGIRLCVRTSTAATGRLTDLRCRIRRAARQRRCASCRHARPDGQAVGEIIESPIISNFKEATSVLEYFNRPTAPARAWRTGAEDCELRLPHASSG